MFYTSGTLLLMDVFAFVRTDSDLQVFKEQDDRIGKISMN